MIAVPVKVVDVTGREGEFSLDKQGFEFRIWPSAYHAAATASGGGGGASFEDPAAIKRGYYAECEGFLQDLYGICFFLLSLPISPPLLAETTRDTDKGWLLKMMTKRQNGGIPRSGLRPQGPTRPGQLAQARDQQHQLARAAAERPCRSVVRWGRHAAAGVSPRRGRGGVVERGEEMADYQC